MDHIRTKWAILEPIFWTKLRKDDYGMCNVQSIDCSDCKNSQTGAAKIYLFINRFHDNLFINLPLHKPVPWWPQKQTDDWRHKLLLLRSSWQPSFRNYSSTHHCIWDCNKKREYHFQLPICFHISLPPNYFKSDGRWLTLRSGKRWKMWRIGLPFTRKRPIFCRQILKTIHFENGILPVSCER